VRRINVFSASVGRSFGFQAENYGDNLMAPLLRSLFEVDPNYVEISKAELIGIGSILDAYDRRRKPTWRRLLSAIGSPLLHVWGSGFMNEGGMAVWPQRLKICAVRGPLSRAKLGIGALPMGDPALLLPLIWKKPATASAAVAVVPHFATYRDFVAAYASRLPKHWRIVDLMGAPEAVTEMIAGADLVASSSLHGLIVADAYGVPSVRLRSDERIKGDGFKYRDYEAFRGEAFGDSIDVEILLAGSYTPSSPKTFSEDARNALLSSFPF
jgi:hypothetical protein